MRAKQKHRREDTTNSFNWDLTIKLVTGLLAVAGVVFGMYQYYRQKDQQRQLELAKREVELCFKASELAARFTQATSQQEANDVKKQFWTIYYGELSIVEKKAVENAMKDFGGALQRWETMTAPPSDFFAPSEFVFYKDQQGITFNQLSYHLSQACRESL